MYIPAHFAVTPDDVQDLLTRPGALNLVTMTPQGLLATLLPFVFDPTVGEHGALQGHVARNNTQWSEPVTGEALAIIQGEDAYISPSWYASKAEHGRVVPTWNYTTAHVYGRLVIHDDPEWLEPQVRRLTGVHEAGFEHPWSMDDAPERFISGQLRAIVGVELVIARIEAKAKLSQNRPEADVDGVIAGLSGRGHAESAADVERAREATRAGGLRQQA
ncbi:FMN-binding negative transcriptional regulator [Arthrobacter sp. RT-1]|uniref:FMN-binding negative transcriptional regulator n=1 Tax=Arthrobacter sp. RT-1 TaxID=2292263 RepID=UPI000E1EE047|nr:FMN-binding negative transcriptional regulator [Arthrobacter sp. RT-1]RDV10974.1 FMN-binding negative transcriptional regulator [Arthrobacter sp. RT-1]